MPGSEGDRLWVGTDRGLAELDPKGRFLALHDPRGVIGYSAVHCLLPRDGDLLVGTSLGLFSFKNGAFSRAFPANPSDKSQVLAVHVDENHRYGWGPPTTSSCGSPGTAPGPLQIWRQGASASTASTGFAGFRQGRWPSVTPRGSP